MTIKTLQDFNREYLKVHVRKEDLFWSTYMGLEKDASRLKDAETAYLDYVSAPGRLMEVRGALSRLPVEAQSSAAEEETRLGLRGWLNFFLAHSIETEKGRSLRKELIELESHLFDKKSRAKLHFTDRNGQRTEATLNTLLVNLSANEDEGVRKSSP